MVAGNGGGQRTARPHPVGRRFGGAADICPDSCDPGGLIIGRIRGLGRSFALPRFALAAHGWRDGGPGADRGGPTGNPGLVTTGLPGLPGWKNWPRRLERTPSCKSCSSCPRPGRWFGAACRASSIRPGHSTTRTGVCPNHARTPSISDPPTARILLRRRVMRKA